MKSSGFVSSTQTCMFCLEVCPPVVYVSPVCNCPASYHLSCKKSWDKEHAHTCPICRNILLYVVNSKNELNTQFNGRHPDETYVSLPGGVASSAPSIQNASESISIVVLPETVRATEAAQQRSTRNQRVYAMIFTLLVIFFMIFMFRAMFS